MTYISPVKPDYYQRLCDSHFGCNLTTCWGSLCLHYGRSETFPWLFLRLSEGKEQKTLVEFSNKTTGCQQSYSFSRIFTEKFTCSIFQHLSASPQLSSFTSWKKTSKTGMRSFFTKAHQRRRRYLPPSFLLTIWIVLMSKWRHDTTPSLTFWTHQGEAISGSPLVSKGHICVAPHVKANWKLQLWGKGTIAFMSWSKRKTLPDQEILSEISMLHTTKNRTERREWSPVKKMHWQAGDARR